MSRTLLSTVFKSGKFGGYSWGGVNSGVSLSNNSVVARARWAFQISQGSVETLFRWDGKCWHALAANIFGKLYTKFHHNCGSFVRDITKNILVSFFLDRVYTYCSWYRTVTGYKCKHKTSHQTLHWTQKCLGTVSDYKTFNYYYDQLGVINLVFCWFAICS